MTTITLLRSGKRPLSFVGELLAHADTHRNSGPSNTRWWAVSVYRTAAGRFVLALEWHTRWQGEMACQTAEVHDTLDAVAEALEAHNPLDRLVGFPSGGDGKYAARQAHVETVLRQAWAALVSDLLGEIGIQEQL